MMKEVLLIHPLGQAAAGIFGLLNLVTGMTRRCFVRALHINFGVLFYALTFFGAGVGALTVRMAVNSGSELPCATHVLSAFIFMAILLCGALSGFVLLRTKRPRWIVLLHRYSNCAAVIVFILQAFTGISALAAVF